MSSEPNTNKVLMHPGGEAPGGAESLDKVRDILFGAQAREYDERFARLEEHLLKEAANVRAEVRERFEALDQQLQTLVESMSAQIKTEAESRAAGDKQLAREGAAATQSIDKKVTQMDGQTQSHMRELRKLVLDQSQLILDEVKRTNGELSGLLQSSVAELRSIKVSKTDLAAWFSEAATKLAGESNSS